ncbi:MAG: tetratricopeptide repeat protein [Spirochaetales bacterium]|uniref:Tetratricopeptide repeat protein n=1 Tax=Candidatus Thalassospirochaeta sargassi TaxID=3119039 RepID=A0AAJ1MLN1_9SPIO|nr:tetratricopeptide repeat protein [Spirochaetales bacterium]
MILPEDRYRFSGTRPKRRRPLVITLIIITVCAALAAVLFFVVIPGVENSSVQNREEVQSIETLWTNQHYEAINLRCEEILSEDPMNQKALIYNGFSYFYRGTSQYSLEEKIPLFDSSLINLRRALLVCNDDILGKVKYIIGKCYFQKGKFYSDLAVKYLEESISAGYTGEDTFEYLGLLNSRLGRYIESVNYYLKAVEINATDMLYLVLAQTYYQLEDRVKSEEYLNLTLNMTTDFSVEQKARYLLGNILIENEEYEKAENEYIKILEKNEKAADAHYYLGDIYDKMGDSVKARYQWRKCLEIDSYHYGAKLKLYG